MESCHFVKFLRKSESIVETVIWLSLWKTREVLKVLIAWNFATTHPQWNGNGELQAPAAASKASWHRSSDRQGGCTLFRVHRVRPENERVSDLAVSRFRTLSGTHDRPNWGLSCSFAAPSKTKARAFKRLIFCIFTFCEEVFVYSFELATVCCLGLVPNIYRGFEKLIFFALPPLPFVQNLNSSSLSLWLSCLHRLTALAGRWAFWSLLA